MNPALLSVASQILDDNSYFFDFLDSDEPKRVSHPPSRLRFELAGVVQSLYPTTYSQCAIMGDNTDKLSFLGVG